MENPVIILGAKGLGRTALEIFTSNNITVYGFLDDDAKLHNSEIDTVTVLGTTDDEGFLKLIGRKCEAFVAVEETKLRKNLVEMLLEVRHTMPCNAIHANAYISPSASIGHGCLVNMGAKIGAGAVLGQHNIINSGVIIEHGVKLGDFVQIGPGSIIGPEVEIADGAFIGSGSTIIGGIRIGKNAQIGAGSVVIGSVEDKKRVFGNPAKEIA
ncbi:MAG: acetyltransferase [Cytophagales bacterium]|nr:acetyltransferase [Cytophagales bacterium]